MSSDADAPQGNFSTATTAGLPSPPGASPLTPTLPATGPPAAPPAPSGPFPQPFGRYVLRGRLGGGGMGTVYLAHDTLLERPVALKVPHADLVQDAFLLECFYREARAAARLQHPHLCPVLDLGEWASTHYLTMPYVAGRRLAETTVGGPREVAQLLHTLALALAEAHRLGVVHLDLKPNNILITPDGRPVVADFGLALRLDVDSPHAHRGLGTLPYMAPEQFDAAFGPVGPLCDVYALGVILYRLLTGQLPFQEADPQRLRRRVLERRPTAPSALVTGIDPALEAVCLTALARRPEDRPRSMTALAAALADYLRLAPTVPAAPPRVPRRSVRFEFVGLGQQATGPTDRADRLYLDVGNDLRPGVVDHHHLVAGAGSTVSLLLAHPALVEAAVAPSRQRTDPFTILLHEKPDLDAVAAAFVAMNYLETGQFPAGAEALAAYVDDIDAGRPALSPDFPHSLYAAYHRLIDRLNRESGGDDTAWVRDGVRLVEFVLAEMAARGLALPEVDAFACPGLFAPEERDAVAQDRTRYLGKLAGPRTAARTARLRLPGQYGGSVAVEALLVRDVQNVDDPQRVVFFKEWARSDSQHSGDGRGFAALCVFHSGSDRQRPRCILSVRPDSKASLRGLGALLDRAEGERRRARFGVDDRLINPKTGAPQSPRRGYDNADPWYDGRAHGGTIVDSPRDGTILTADEIEAIFLSFGEGAAQPLVGTAPAT